MSTQSNPNLPNFQEDYQLSKEQITSFQENGHICLRGIASKVEIQPYRTLINQVVKEHAKKLPPLTERSTAGKAFIQVGNLWEKSKEIQKFVFAKRFAKIAAELLGVNGVRIYHDQALFKEPGGGYTPWHQDQNYWPLDTDKTVTMWMPLTDISNEMGSMSFVSKSQKDGHISNLIISDDSHHTFESYIAEKALDSLTYGSMAAGDATFHTGWTIHRAPGNPTERPREVMTIIYFADGATISGSNEKARINDLKRWLPGLKEGDRANSPLNPLVYHKTNI